MTSPLTGPLAEWAASCRYDDLPSTVLDRARLQVPSVLAAVFAGAQTGVGEAASRASRAWGTGDEARLIPEGTRVPVHTAAYVNAARSVSLDFDDYLFAGHTGHSAVLGPLAFAEGASGRAAITAQVVANECAGRLGAAFLFGPHNGQMWTYIHALGGAVVGGRLLGLDAAKMRHAIGIALAQPPYPLDAAFFGPDSKAMMASGPLVEGLRAATLAAEGATGAEDILEAMLKRFAPKPFRFVFSGYGDAWVTDSLTYKLYPGCAYIDNAIDAFIEGAAAFAEQRGRSLVAEDVQAVRVEATMFTAGMEALSTPHRMAGTLRPIDVNFSVPISLGVLIVCGSIDADTLAPSSLAKHHDQIMEIAAKVTLEQDPALTLGVGGLADAGIDLGRYLSEGSEPESLAGADFSRYEMRFPARVTIETGDGSHTVETAIPRGGAGRPWAETVEGVREKFMANATHLADPKLAFERAFSLDSASSVRDVVDAVVAR